MLLPIRATVLLAAIGLGFGLDLEPSGIGPSLVAADRLPPVHLGPRADQRRPSWSRSGAARTPPGMVVTLLGLISGAVFPIALLPPVLRAIAEWNPFAIAIDGVRDALIGGTGWGPALPRHARGSSRSRPSGWPSACSASARRLRASAAAARWGTY